MGNAQKSHCADDPLPANRMPFRVGEHQALINLCDMTVFDVRLSACDGRRLRGRKSVMVCAILDDSYDGVRRYATRWRQAGRRDVMDAPAFIPLLFRSGEAHQFDWSHENVKIAGKPRRVKVAHVRLCASG